MSKKIIDSVELENANEWSFPKIDFNLLADKSFTSLNGGEYGKFHKDYVDNESNKKLLAKEAELDKKMKEIDALKDLLSKNISTTQALNDKLLNLLNGIDNEITDLIVDIIKKSAKKIILKDIQIDPQLITGMIDNLKQKIIEQNGLYHVLLSEEDAKIFQAADEKTNLTIKTDPELKRGDIVIKSNHAEIRAIIDNMIDKMIDTNGNG